mmetsp:Transcript_69042/g.125998  ORF Transcript_69042/g.125998 Transcript_69042/m.125998 type:complete len:229 (-) Transcript_69042:19-705(-)
MIAPLLAQELCLRLQSVDDGLRSCKTHLRSFVQLPQLRVQNVHGEVGFLRQQAQSHEMQPRERRERALNRLEAIELQQGLDFESPSVVPPDVPEIYVIEHNQHRSQDHAQDLGGAKLPARMLQDLHLRVEPLLLPIQPGADAESPEMLLKANDTRHGQQLPLHAADGLLRAWHGQDLLHLLRPWQCRCKPIQAVHIHRAWNQRLHCFSKLGTLQRQSPGDNCIVLRLS